jgi:hypothetical protein
MAREVLLRERGEDETPKALEVGELVTERRPRLELAWVQSRFHDNESGRDFYSRTAIARFSNVQPIMTFDFWVDDVAKCHPIWAEILRSLVLCDYVEDPTRRLNNLI